MDNLIKEVIEAQKRSFHRAFETAVRTGTALVYEIDGEIVEIKPPFRYKLVKIKPNKKKPRSS